MKRYIIGLSILLLLFASCSKENQCVKGRIIDVNPCSGSWGVQILDGPKIGTQYGTYDNVIQLYGVPPFNAKYNSPIIYFKYGKKNPKDDHPCPANLPNISFSSVERSLVSMCDAENQ